MSRWRCVLWPVVALLGCSSEPLSPAEAPDEGGSTRAEEDAEAPILRNSARVPQATWGRASDSRFDQSVFATIYAGQSNAKGIATDSLPRGVPNESIPYWPTLLATKTKSNAFVALGPLADGTHGAECTYGLAINAARRDVAILKVARGGSAIAHWVQGSAYPYNAVLTREIREFAAALSLRFVQRSFTWHFVWDQGETEASAETDSGAKAWASDFATLVASVDEACRCKVVTHIVRTDFALMNGRAPHVSAVREQQAAASPRLIDSDNLPTIDGVHRTGAAQNILGERIAASVLAAAAASQ